MLRIANYVDQHTATINIESHTRPIPRPGEWVQAHIAGYYGFRKLVFYMCVKVEIGLENHHCSVGLSNLKDE